MDLNNLYEKIEIISKNIKNKNYTSFEFNNKNKKRKLDEIEENKIKDDDEIKGEEYEIKEEEDEIEEEEIEITYNKSKFYIYDKKFKKNILESCPICYDEIKIIDKITLHCNHTFCNICHYNWEKTCFLGKKELSCPLCRKTSSIIPV
jgi:hypothetical protein